MSCAFAVLKTSPTAHFAAAPSSPRQCPLTLWRLSTQLTQTIRESMYKPEVVAEARRFVKQGKEKGGRIAICETIAEAFLAAGIAWYDHALPDHVGISVWNRTKCRVMGTDVHAHGGEILDVGFSWQKAADATAFECPPEPLCAEAVTANTDIVKFSAGLIPPLRRLR